MKAGHITIRRLRKTEKLLRAASFYDQKRFYAWNSGAECETPACALGHWAASAGYSLLDLPAWDYAFPGLKAAELGDLFSEKGCGNAGTDPIKAADYIKSFIERKLAEG